MLIDPTKKPPDKPAFALFVVARAGHVVRRFGTPHAIGYRHTADTKDAPAKHSWDEETIHAITVDEYERHRREYDAELFDPETNPDGGLTKSTREAWEKQRAAQKKADDEARQQREAEAKKAATATEGGK